MEGGKVEGREDGGEGRWREGKVKGREGGGREGEGRGGKVEGREGTECEKLLTQPPCPTQPSQLQHSIMMLSSYPGGRGGSGLSQDVVLLLWLT